MDNYAYQLRKVAEDAIEKQIRDHRNGDMKTIYETLTEAAADGKVYIGMRLTQEEINVLSKDGFSFSYPDAKKTKAEVDSGIFTCTVMWLVT